MADCGFVAHSDGVSYGKGEGAWTEWDYERLEPVLGHVDTAAAELAECSFAPLGAERCVQLLHGELGFWVQDFLDPGDPPPAYGLFPHVSAAALAQRVAELEASGGLRLGLPAAGVAPQP